MTRTYQEHPIATLANGQVLTLPVFHIRGQDSDAPSTYIQASIHGAEVQGNAVIYQLLACFEQTPPKGDVTLIPYANPYSVNIKNGEMTQGRFDPTTGENWNRAYYFNLDFLDDFVAEHRSSDVNTVKTAFKQQLRRQLDAQLSQPLGLPLSQHIALRLQSYASQADIVLDLHTGPISAPHLYVPSYARASARAFNLPHHLLIPNEFSGALDEACFCPWWSLHEAYQAAGRDDVPVLVEAFTVELGSQEQIDLQQATDDAHMLCAYLASKDLLSQADYPIKTLPRYACSLANYKTVYAPKGGHAEFLAPLGEPLPAGEPLARILSLRDHEAGQAVSTVTLTEAALPILHHTTSTVHTGAELYKYFAEYTEL